MIRQIQNLWTKLSLYGSQDKPPGISKRIILANQIGVTLGIIAIGFIIPWTIKGNVVMITANVFIAAVHFATLWLNHLGYYNLSRYLLLFWLPTLTFVSAGMVGEAVGVHLIFYTITGFSCLMFDPKEKLKLAVAVLYPMILFGVLIWMDFKIFPNMIGEGESISGFNHFANFVLISLSMFYLFRASEKTETEYKNLYEKHIESQRLLDEERGRAIYSMKMAALGEMAGGIAHEINSPLNVITILSEQLQKRLPMKSLTEEGILESVTKINTTAHRISEIVMSLRSITQTGPIVPFREADINDILHETLVLCKERFRSKDIHLSFEIQEYLPKVYCRSSEISQVLLNLLNNACDALEGVDQPTINISMKATQEFVQLGVSNNGPGIDKEIRDKIFLPFFTTKGSGKGTGLGLSISKGLIEANRGKIYLDPDSKETRFLVELNLSRGVRT
jgi:signal transduction histidine kinase